MPRAAPDRAFDQLARGLGILVWLVIGAPTWFALVRSASSLAWTALYLGFGVAFVLATSELPIERRRWLVALESAIAAALAVIGMPHFEGAMFAIVAAQTPTLFGPAAAIAWDLAQAAVLFPIILPSHGALGAAKATGEYLAFAVFALAVVAMREREASARRELARAHSILLGTQALLADDARAHERARVAREVHDAIGHGLTAASIHLQLAARSCSGNASTAVAAASEAVRATLQEVRTLVDTMRDDITVDLGTAIRAMCAGIREPAVHVAIAPRLRVADAGVAHVIFRCVQEALTNALRHARANGIWVELTRDERGMAVEVRDDGVGASELQFGNGLDGIRARIGEVGGSVEVVTAAGRGLALRAWIPAEGVR